MQCGKVIGHLMHLAALLMAVASIASSSWITANKGTSVGLWSVCGGGVAGGGGNGTGGGGCLSISATQCQFTGNFTLDGQVFASALPECSTWLAVRAMSVLAILCGGAHFILLVVQLLTQDFIQESVFYFLGGVSGECRTPRLFVILLIPSLFLLPYVQTLVWCFVLTLDSDLILCLSYVYDCRPVQVDFRMHLCAVPKKRFR
jgi:hypothetical protein